MSNLPLLPVRDGHAIPVFRHDYGAVMAAGVGATVITLGLTSAAMTLTEGSIYRLCANTSAFYAYGKGGLVGKSDGSQTYLPTDFPEYIQTTTGGTLLVACSPYASGGKLYVQRMV